MLRKYVKNSIILILFTLLLVLEYGGYSVNAQESDIIYSIDNVDDWKNLSNVKGEAKYILNSDINIGEYTLTVDKEAYIKIDFNGHTVTGRVECDNSKSKIMIENNGTFVFEDSSDEKNGGICYIGSNTYFMYELCCVYNTGQLYLQGGNIDVHVKSTLSGSQMRGKVCAVESEGYVSIPFGKINVDIDVISRNGYGGYIYGILNNRGYVDLFGADINVNVNAKKTNLIDIPLEEIKIYEYALYNNNSDEIYVKNSSVKCSCNITSQTEDNYISCYGIWNNANGDITFDASSLDVKLTSDNSDLFGNIGGICNYSSGKIKVLSGSIDVISEDNYIGILNGILNEENGKMDIGKVGNTNKDSLKIIVEPKKSHGTVLNVYSLDSVNISGGYYRGNIFISTEQGVSTYLGLDDKKIDNDLLYIECQLLNTINNSPIYIYDGVYDIKYKPTKKDLIILPDGYELCSTISGKLCVSESKNGWYIENGLEYWYENGVKQGTIGRGKEIYDPDTDAWYWLDSILGGAKAKGKDVYQESSGGKWVRYDENGHMVKGWNSTNEGTYYFDPITGAMCKGNCIIDGKECRFDENTGIGYNGWYSLDGKDYWYENGIRQGYDMNNSLYRGKEIYDPSSDAWYWLDNIQQGAKATNKDVYQESSGGKWVRYDESGHMIKGWSDTSNGSYYFDIITGAMFKGWHNIAGQSYYFDENTGILQ